MTGLAGVPATGVTAVALTVTVTGNTSSGYVSAYPSGAAPPRTSNLNFAAGRNTANLVIVPVGPSGAVDLYVASSRPSDLVADIAGWVAEY